MTLDPEKVESYLNDPAKAIKDAQDDFFSEHDAQIMIDEIYKDLDPSWKKIGPYQKLIFGWSMEAPKMLMAQDYMDEVLKPFIKKLNTALHWNLKTPADFLK
ncbi:hypothetical protein [Sporolactobacillus spathodeae]|uniref:Uncharacterized protein n=1 Tax=Sporolactobacillus spathodeae TaxID=1465502 RepID=A0ABS2QDP7_9BACL|nr:hypothetical protein [Sporolactobacillus spathodeae]MBM7659052.1 hypothetical protein [Sporolactobacillus spathodeae]